MHRESAESSVLRKVRLFFESIGEERGLEKGLAKGRAKGLAQSYVETTREALLVVLTERGLVPSDEERARIEKCTDVAQLALWHKRAVTAASVTEALATPVAASPPAPNPRRTRPPSRARTSR